MDALKEHPFVGSPLCRMSDGKDLVRVELTYQPIDTRRGLKAGGSLYPSAGEWPRQFAPATRPTTALPGEGDDTTISVDSSRQSKTKHHTRPHTEDSNHPAIAYHHQTTSSNIYFSCQPAEEENTDAVTYSASQQKKKKKKKKNRTRYDSYDFSYPLHEKYTL